MIITPHILLGSGRLVPFVKQIKVEFDEAINKITEKVSISDIDVVIRDNPDGAIPEIGVGGYTLDANTILVSLDPNFPNFINTIEKELSRTLAHEIHHVLRWRGPGYGKTLLEAIITEGLADHFDIEINNESPEPWSIALNQEQLEGLLENARAEFGNKDYDHDSWFFGSSDKNIPKWAIYSLGFKLVGEYLQKNPDKKPSNLYKTKSEEFI